MFNKNVTFCLYILVSFIFSSCAQKTPQDLAQFQRVYGDPATKINVEKLLDDNYAQTKHIEVQYITNRKALNSNNNCGANTFDNSVSNAISYGQCIVSVPQDHWIGDITYSEDSRASSHQNYKFLKHSVNDAAWLNDYLAQAPSDVLVFVHGFNVPFHQAVLRAAQIKYDMKFKGSILLVSWPAGANGNSYMIHKTYEDNKNSALKSYQLIHHMADALIQSHKKAHFLVHSMGHQVFLPGLITYFQNKPLENPSAVFAEGIFHAPDISTELAIRYFKNIQPYFDRTTVYCSHKDYAISASQYYNDNDRLGHCFNLENTDVINVSLLHEQLQKLDYLGHSYYASRALLGDMFQVLLNIEASKRLFIRKAEPYAPENYFLRP